MRYEENRLPSDAALVRLYNDAGWVAYTDDLPALRTAFVNSLYLLCVYEEEELVGLLRAVGDGVSILYIQDILVLADRRRHGIGTALMTHTLKKYASVRQKVLSTDNTPELRAFYNSLGFVPFEETGLVAFYFMNR